MKLNVSAFALAFGIFMALFKRTPLQSIKKHLSNAKIEEF